MLLQYGSLTSLVTCTHASYAMLSIGIPWDIPRVTCSFLVHTQAQTRTEHCITVLHVYHAIENTVANAINATYAWRMQRMIGSLGVMPFKVQWLSCILIGCSFYGMVYIFIFYDRSCTSFIIICWAFLSSTMEPLY